MQTFKFITQEPNKTTIWCTTNQMETFFTFIQYVLDNANNPERFYIADVTNNKAYRLVGLANYFCMRKRNFEERMKDIKTYDKRKVVIRND